MKELQNRWKTEDGQHLLREIIQALKDCKRLDQIPGLLKYNGKYDLRGFVSPTKIGETTKSGKFSITQVNRLQFYNIQLENVDLSYSDLTLTDFIDSKIDNIYAIRSKWSNVRFLGTNISNSIFDMCSFEQSMMGLYRKPAKRLCHFENTYFIKSNFKNTNFPPAEYRNTTFDNCILKEVDFDGTMFYDCVFKGKLDSVQFYGFSKYESLEAMGATDIDLKVLYNPMQNIDFTQAQMLGVSFRTEINLSSCKFPEGEEYLLIPNDTEKLLKAKPLIEEAYEGKEKDHYVSVLEKVVVNWLIKEKNSHDLLDKSTLNFKKISGSADKFFSILREVIS